MTCDVIIPTFNNSKTLPLTLSALFAQRVPLGWQVHIIVSDDGSTDNTIAVARQVCRASLWSNQIIGGTHVGAAGARNRALTRSTADIVLFLGADIILKQNALLAHLTFHSQHPDPNRAALGVVMWDPRVKPTCFMEWMTHGGSQNNFDAILGQTAVDPKHFFYGSNLSLKRQLLVNNHFRQDYQSYGWEDIDLGRCLAGQHKIKLNLLPEAIGHHRHFYSARQIFARQRSVGLGFRTFARHHPSVAVKRTDSVLHKIKYVLIQASGILLLVKIFIVLSENKISTPYLYKIATDSEFWLGFHNLYPHTKLAIHTFIHNESTT